MAEHVIPLAFLRVAQYFVGFVDFFELIFSGLLFVVPGLQVGVVLARHTPIGFFEFFLRRSLLDSEDVVIISF
jgi:hypothetical protein